MHESLKRACEAYLKDRIVPEPRILGAICFTWLQCHKPTVRGRKPEKPAAAAEVVEFLQEQRKAGTDPIKALIEDRKWAAAMYGISYEAVADAHGRLMRMKAADAPADAPTDTAAETPTDTADDAPAHAPTDTPADAPTDTDKATPE